MVYISLILKEVPLAYAHTRKWPIIVLPACFLVLAVPALPLHAEEVRPDLAEQEKVQLPAGKTIAEGIASYYANRFNGRKTRSGARYDPEKLTAAHPDLPFGTRVKVVNLANGREATVTVNDRCRRKSMPFIDLSRAAARKLGFLGKGTARVAFNILDGSSEP
jgi:peptidoglycan lytic transglycosylase